MEEWAEMVIADPSRTLQSKSERFLLDHFRPLEVEEGALDDEIVVTSDLYEVFRAFRACRPSA